MSTISTSEIHRIIEGLKGRQYENSTAKTYLGIWRKFNQFVIKLDDIPRSWEERVSLYGGYLVDHGIHSSTLKTYITAIKQTLLTDGYAWNDDALYLHTLTSVTGACKKNNDKSYSKFPIKRNLMELILCEIERMYSKQPYLDTLYKTIILFSYYGLLRIGEVTMGSHVVKAKDVHVGTNKDKIKLVLYSSKTHGKRNKPQSIRMDALDESDNQKLLKFCPFEITREYSNIRNGYIQDDEQFFVFSDHSPVKPCHVRKVLKRALKNLNLNPAHYGTHSFRTGRATDLMKLGYQIEEIKQLGRWKSNAVYRYLRN